MCARPVSSSFFGAIGEQLCGLERRTGLTAVTDCCTFRPWVTQNEKDGRDESVTQVRTLPKAPGLRACMVDPDGTLVAAAREYPQAFLALYDRYFERVLGYVRLRIRDDVRRRDDHRRQHLRPERTGPSCAASMRCSGAAPSRAEAQTVRPGVRASRCIRYESTPSSRREEGVDGLELSASSVRTRGASPSASRRGRPCWRSGLPCGSRASRATLPEKRRAGPLPPPRADP
jgi:hypothetical protein